MPKRERVPFHKKTLQRPIPYIMLLKKISIYYLLIIVWSPLTAQVSHIKFKHSANNEQYIIHYDLEKSQNESYFETELVAFIGGIRVNPSKRALLGDVGVNIKTGKRKKIIWNYPVDLEQIIGGVEFIVRARRQYIQPPPTAATDLVVGTTLGSVGLATALWGGSIVLKKGRVDPTVSASKHPIIFYYTFCESTSPSFESSLVEISQLGQSSACDAHFETANKKFNRGIFTGVIGAAVIAGGIYTLLAKPFLKPKMRVYRKKYYLAVQPTFNWAQQGAGTLAGKGVFGARMVYQFGK